MIGKLSGTVDTKKDDSLIVDVGGVGYVVFCSRSTLARVPEASQLCRLLVTTLTQDGAVRLVGFLDEDEQSLFNLLISVQGVGMRLALVLLGHFPSVALLVEYVKSGNRAAITSVPGVGKRLAARLVSELSEKIGQIRFSRLPQPFDPICDDAVEALVALGFPRSLIHQSLDAILAQVKGVPLTSQAVVRAGLKVLGDVQ